MDHTAKLISAECITPLSQTLWCASYCRVNCSKIFRSQEHTISQILPGMPHSAETLSGVCTPPRSQSPGCAPHLGVNLRGVYRTGESISAVWFTPQSQNRKFCLSLIFSKEQSGEIFLRVNTTIVHNCWDFHFIYNIWQDAGNRTRVAAIAARCATNELHTSLFPFFL